MRLLRLRSIPTTKLDRRRERSRARVSLDRVFDALQGPPISWGPGKQGETRFWNGATWTYHEGPQIGVISTSGWYLTKLP